MTARNWTDDDEVRLAEYLVERFHHRTTGRAEPECVRNFPRDVYFVGNLRPEPQGDTSSVPLQLADLLTKVSPTAFGAEFLLGGITNQDGVNVTLNWSCYYRIFPTFEQQRSQQLRRDADEATDAEQPSGSRTGSPHDNNEEGDPVSSLNATGLESEQAEQDSSRAESDSPEIAATRKDRHRSRVPNDSLFIRFRKVSCSASGLIKFIQSPNGEWDVDSIPLTDSIARELLRVQHSISQDNERLKTNTDPNSHIAVPETAVSSKEQYRIFLQSFGQDITPHWSWSVTCTITPAAQPAKGDLVLAFEFSNISAIGSESPNTEGYFFDTRAHFEFPNALVRPFELLIAPKGFRYDRNVWGRGVNCSVSMDANDAKTQTFDTTHLPVYSQLRFETQNTPAASFSDLAKNPNDALQSILKAMRAYSDEWNVARSEYVARDSTWDATHGPEFDRDRDIYLEEIKRFENGCNAISSNADVRLAFQLTNETFAKGPKTQWRLFQIVFLVSQIPGIASLASNDAFGTRDREFVDIIYFPTGGGKTEAYLATIIFHCFFDRIRGKTAGVTAWTRFPLRLLTLQQTQRVLDVIGTAELVRSAHKDPRLSGREVNGFSVGYFVGEGGSPNAIANPHGNQYSKPEDYALWSTVNDAAARQKWKRAVRCPACPGSKVVVDFDVAATRLIHRCTNSTCKFPGGILPILIVDNEIFRYLPTVIVGTIDKLAGIGNQRKFAMLLGQVAGSCSIHGYYLGECCQRDCRDRRRLNAIPPKGLSGPTLFVQDELHLLKEGLGTFDGHYETFTQQLLIEFGSATKLKIIASSATIEAFERQVNHLYGRESGKARIFPSLGPTNGKSFYAYTRPFPQRLYVGVLPHNKTIFNAVLEIIEISTREIQALYKVPAGSANPFGGSVSPGSTAWHQLIDFYWSTLTYFSSNRELNSIRTDIEGDVVPSLLRDGCLPIELPELTSNTSTDDVSTILEKLEQPGKQGAPLDVVLATAMVSHGVDIDRLNSMIFYGMPRQNAEYIQASSRVGRSHVGVVFNCLHPVRERDQSHYSYFIKFHEFLGQLVEAVAINRWAKYSINRTLPGLFMATVLQICANRFGGERPGLFTKLAFVRGKVSDGTLNRQQFIDILKRAYGVTNPSTHAEVTFHDEIETRVNQYFDWIVSPGTSEEWLSNVLFPKPMRSLRDVDEPIKIELDAIGTHWTN